jgi:hypothetical protein
MVIVGGVIVSIAVLVVALTALGGGSSTGHESSGAAVTSTGGAKKARPGGTHAKTHGVSAPAASPAETRVAVLNGTGTTGLAHKLSANLQQSGYTQATALSGTPSGSHSTTIVEYSSGHRADAAHVAQALEVTGVQPMEPSVSSLSGSATVVVIAGLDKATAGSGEAAGGATGTTP